MPQELIHISVRKLPVRLVTLVLLIVAGVGSYFAVRWYIGNTMAEYFNTTENDLNVARTAISFAPNDPLPHWRIAQVSQKILPLDQQQQAIASYEKAVSLSPNDYRFWMSLGRAYEQAGDPAKAEEALRRAVALAPAYSYPHWYLGNLLLRNARYDEAFVELRLASEADGELQPQQFNLAWQIYNGDPAALKKAVGENPAVHAYFALYLITQKQYEDGLALWNGLSSEEKKANRDPAEAMIMSLRNDTKFHDALRVWNDVAPEKYHAAMGKVFDGSFEDGGAGGTVFGWHVKSAPQMQAGIDADKSHGGGRSLRMAFRVPVNLEQVNVAQLIAVLPRTEYEVECYVSTEKLQTGSAPQVQILDAASGAELTSSAQAPGGTNDWNRISLTFKTGDFAQGVILKIVRVSCSNEQTPVCPIFGSVWYDDFSIKRRN
ncbi:MAG TPA: tetratricopeptide repeat protein [Pyrinomonadaceae bacterium]|nr:tetratricopeptide repeat protein [Pyrinomonadaceae bacterium]